MAKSGSASPTRERAAVAATRLAAALRRLPSGQRSAVILIGVEGKSYDEAAQTIGTSVGAVRSAPGASPRPAAHRNAQQRHATTFSPAPCNLLAAAGKSRHGSHHRVGARLPRLRLQAHRQLNHPSLEYSGRSRGDLDSSVPAGTKAPEVVRFAVFITFVPCYAAL